MTSQTARRNQSRSLSRAGCGRTLPTKAPIGLPARGCGESAAHRSFHAAEHRADLLADAEFPLPTFEELACPYRVVRFQS